MQFEVRQLSFGEVLDQSFKVLRSRFVLLTGIMALFYVPYTLVMSLMQPATEEGVPQLPVMTMVMVAVGGALVMLMVMPLAQLAVTKGVADTYLGKPFTLGSAYAAAAKAYLPYLGTSLLILIFLLPLMLLLVLPAIYFMVCWVLIGAIAMAEDTFGMRALKRSRGLVQGHWWRTFGLLIVASLFGLVAAGLQIVLSAIPFLGVVLNGFAQAIVAAFGVVVTVVMYFDLRCRKEDFDLQVLSSQVQEAPAALPAAQV